MVYFQTYPRPPLSSRENLRFRSLFALFPLSNAGGSVPSRSSKLSLSKPTHLNNPCFYAKIQHYSTILFLAVPGSSKQGLCVDMIIRLKENRPQTVRSEALVIDAVFLSISGSQAVSDEFIFLKGFRLTTGKPPWKM